MGQICNTIMQAIHSIFAKQGSKFEFTPWDFIPEYGKKKKKKIVQEKQKQSVDELKAALQSIASTFGTRKRKHKHG